MTKRFVLLFSFITLSFSLAAQSKVTEDLQKNSDSKAFFFYNNTLRMINQQEDPEFDALVKDIEKMKLLIVRKNSSSFNYSSLVNNYKKDAFEEAMSSRFEGKNFDVYFKTEGKKTKGMLVLVNDATDLYVLDIVGSIALNQISKLYKELDESSDLGSKIRNFTDQGKKKEVKEDEVKNEKESDN
jgi:hypothetical protein